MIKLNYMLTLLLFLAVSTSSFASFPVERTAEATTDQEVVNQETSEETTFTSPAAAVAAKSKGIALLLWWFIGFLAAHRWYAGTPVWASVVFILTFGGFGVWWLIDGIRIMTGDMNADGGWQADFF